MPLTQLADLGAPARDLAERSLDWLDRHWDASVALFRMPNDALYEDGQSGAAVHLVRETAWYALGLLLRNADGDIVRAVRAVDALLAYQFDAPGSPTTEHGIARRTSRRHLRTRWYGSTTTRTGASSSVRLWRSC